METVRKIKKKGGRPKKAIKKEVRSAVRFSKAEYFIIREKAAKAGVKPSAYIRWTAIHTVIKPRLTEEELQIVRGLIGMANNLNQIAKAAHVEGMFKTMLYFEEYRNSLDQLLNKLRYAK